jgi:hypothetical protein
VSDESEPWHKKYERYGMEPLELGDSIECDVQNPTPATLVCQLVTPESLAYGRELLASRRWRKSKPTTN